MTTEWVFDPTVSKLFIVVAGIVLIYAIGSLLQRAASRSLESTDARYHARKFAPLLGYLAAIVPFVGVFSDRMSEFTVAFGVVGAGIAFARQEVIASLAG